MDTRAPSGLLVDRYRSAIRKPVWIHTFSIGVAGTAQVSSTDMGWTFTTGNDAVMTTDTGTDNLRMIDRARSNGEPDIGGMTGLAAIGGVDVLRVLTG